MKNFMQFVVNNWALIVAFICVIIVAVQRITEFVALPTSKKMNEVKAILLEWVRSAESELGNKTGAFKLAQVYQKFCKAYPYLKKWFPIEKFDFLVKEALNAMEKSFNNETTKINALGKVIKVEAIDE